MSGDLLLGIVAGVLVCAGLLFLSMIHLFMIPKDIMRRDTDPRDVSTGPDSKRGEERANAAAEQAGATGAAPADETGRP